MSYSRPNGSASERLRCHHLSGSGVNSRCRRVAIATVRVKFGKRWSRWILACAEHEASDHWYRERIKGKPIVEYVDEVGEVVVGHEYTDGPWRKVQRGTLDDWRPQKRRGRR